MKLYLTLIALLFVLSASRLTAQTESAKEVAEQPVRLDSLRYNLRLRELTARRDALTQTITQADSRRGITLDGATPAEQEAYNMEQDSVCLDLRSQLVDINLEIDELTAQGPVQQTSTPNVALPATNTVTLPALPATTHRPSLREIKESVEKEE